MSQISKIQRKSLKTDIHKAILQALANNPSLKDKKVIKAIDKSSTDIAKKIIKATKVVKKESSVKKSTKPTKVVAKKPAAKVVAKKVKVSKPKK